VPVYVLNVLEDPNFVDPRLNKPETDGDKRALLWKRLIATDPITTAHRNLYRCRYVPSVELAMRRAVDIARDPQPSPFRFLLMRTRGPFRCFWPDNG
jgi:hypothetical protein